MPILAQPSPWKTPMTATDRLACSSHFRKRLCMISTMKYERTEGREHSTFTVNLVKLTQQSSWSPIFRLYWLACAREISMRMPEWLARQHAVEEVFFFTEVSSNWVSWVFDPYVCDFADGISSNQVVQQAFIVTLQSTTLPKIALI